MMLSQIEYRIANDPAGQQFCKTLGADTSLTTLVLTAWRMALWIARLIVEQQLTERAKIPTQWKCCSVCGTKFISKGFIKRKRLTLVGGVEWRRRVGRCPRRCPESQSIPFERA